MHRIEAPGATDNNRFTEGNPAAGVLATEVSADWLNAVQEEIVGVITAAGMEPQTAETEDYTQLAAAIARLILDAGNLGAPPGQVAMFAGDAAPNGWLAMNGATVSRAAYPNLWAFAQTSGNLAASEGAKQPGQFGPGDGSTTFSLPDVQGYFFRAWNPGSGIDGGRAFGSEQQDAFQGHVHTGDKVYAKVGNTDGVDSTPEGYSDQNIQALQTGYGDDGTNGTPRVADETRPVNIAYLYCIKY